MQDVGCRKSFSGAVSAEEARDSCRVELEGRVGEGCLDDGGWGAGCKLGETDSGHGRRKGLGSVERVGSYNSCIKVERAWRRPNLNTSSQCEIVLPRGGAIEGANMIELRQSREEDVSPLPTSQARYDNNIRACGQQRVEG